MKRNKRSAGELPPATTRSSARVQQSLLSVAVAVGQINMFSNDSKSSDAYQCTPALAHVQLHFLLTKGGFTERELVPALKRGILQCNEQTGQLVCFMGWVRWLVAAMVLTFAVGFALAGWAVIVLGEHSLTWAAVTAMCGVFCIAALFWLQAFVYGPWRVALRAARKLRVAGY